MMLKQWRKKRRDHQRDAALAPHRALETFNQYIATMPSAQNAIDLIPGWSTSFPPDHDVVAGSLATYNDNRITWALSQFGSVQDKHVLELGPLEAGHTYMLEKAGAIVDAIEANQLAFMRCLVVKEIMGLTRAHFWLGDFVKWLEKKDTTYDLIIASGVLYHMKDPLRLLELLAQRSTNLFLWTHVMSEEAMPKGDPRRLVFATEPEIRDFHGVKVRSYRRTYLQAAENPAFCGGPEDEHRWLEKDDLVAALLALGYKSIDSMGYDPNHMFGPAISLFASK